MRHLITTLSMICFLASALYGGEEDGLKLETVRARGYGNATIIAAGMKNHTGSPIRAFRATLFRLNDFDEAERVCAIEFSSDSEFRTSRGPTKRHIIQPGETVFYVIIANNNGTGETFFTAGVSEFAPAKGQFRLQVSKVVTSVGADATDSRTDAPTSRKSNNNPLQKLQDWVDRNRPSSQRP